MASKDAAGGPPFAACETLKKTLETKAKAISTYETIKKTVKKIIKIIISIRYGIIPLDVIAADLVAAIGAIASAAAKSLLSAASGAMQALLESIISLILQILLAAPNAIFSLVAIPLEKAKESAKKEKLYASSAQKNLSAAQTLLSKWFKGVDGTRFYKQMKNALPHITNALSLIKQMLDDFDTTTPDGPNAIFDEAKYDLVRDEIKTAIKITTPQSMIDSKTGTSQMITSRREQERKKRMIKIEQDYTDQKKIIDEDYMKEMVETQAKIKLTTSSTGLESALPIIQALEYVVKTMGQATGNIGNLDESAKLNYIAIKHQDKLKDLEADKQQWVAELELELSQKSYTNESEVIGQLHGVYEQFKYDMQIMSNNLSDFLKNVKDAYIEQIKCQQYSNTVYNIRSMINTLIRLIIWAIRKVGNASSEVVEIALKTAYGTVSVAQETFVTGTQDWEAQAAGKKKTSSTLLSTKVAVGNSFLQVADATLNAFITESLIKLINSDDVLAAGSEDFNNFQTRLAKVPDWDGVPNVWVPHPLSSSSVNPYIQLIADATIMVAQIPTLSFSSNPTDQQSILSTLSDISDGFSQIFNHNSIIFSTLSSYTPYQSSESGQLKKILENAGLLETFALGLSLLNVLSELYEMSNTPLADRVPNLKNCKKFYPDLFKTTTAVEAANREQVDKPPANVSANVQNKTQDNESNLENVRAAVKTSELIEDAKTSGLQNA